MTPSFSAIRPRRASRARLFAAAVLAGLLAATLAGCSAAAPQPSYWTDSVRSAPPVVREAYAFAHDHPDVLQGIPCYCGCGAIGHTSNYDCYVSGLDEAGVPVVDEHALGCSICVDIALDAKRLLADGRSLPEIRSWIDATYSPYGPSNMP